FLICCALFLFNNEVKDESNPKIETVPQVTAGIPMDTPMTLPETEDVPADPGNWRDNRIMADPSYIYEDVNGESSVFGSSYQRNQILSITVLASVTNAPEDSWDISAEKDGSVLAWVIPRGGNHSLYDLYIAGYGGIWATEDTCYTLFNGYINAESISFNSSFHTDGATTMNNMFYACRSLRTLDLTGFVTSSVTDMSGMFWKCGSLQFLDLTGFDTRNVTDMAAMFSDCTALRSVDLHSFETSNVTLLTAMFYLCESMKEISLTNFDTANVTSTAKMFYGCTNLISVDVSTWDTSNVREMNGMFKNCPNLTDMRLGQWETDSATNMKDFRDNWWEQFN
ncbi:MAG: BspA family leucine-rich repeat surface protein, partial [Agathobacter sp.]|nr:BspA family leucine-rich repeat surface protein [Agathobacter sp.]